MHISVIWHNPTRSHIDRAEFGKGMSFKRKLGFKPASLSRSIEIDMPDKIGMSWKRELEAAINEQFQFNTKSTVYISGVVARNKIERTKFVISARNPKSFSNQVANGLLRLIANANGKNQLTNIIDVGYKPHRKIV